MLLHTLNGSPTSTAYQDCLRLLTAEDALLLLGDGVYAALIDSAAYTALQASGAKLYALQDDVAAAGLSMRLGEQIEVVDFTGFAALTEHYPSQQAWY